MKVLVFITIFVLVYSTDEITKRCRLGGRLTGTTDLGEALDAQCQQFTRGECVTQCTWTTHSCRLADSWYAYDRGQRTYLAGLQLLPTGAPLLYCCVNLAAVALNCDWQWVSSSLTDKHAFNASLSHEQSDFHSNRDIFIRDVMTEVKFGDAYKAEVCTMTRERYRCKVEHMTNEQKLEFRNIEKRAENHAKTSAKHRWGVIEQARVIAFRENNTKTTEESTTTTSLTSTATTATETQTAPSTTPTTTEEPTTEEPTTEERPIEPPRSTRRLRPSTTTSTTITTTTTVGVTTTATTTMVETTTEVETETTKRRTAGAPIQSGRRTTTERPPCPTDDFSPCVSETDANDRFKSCCISRGMSDACVKLCTYDATRDEILKAAALNECPTSGLSNMLSCASNDKDASPCCQHRGILTGEYSHCQPLCNPSHTKEDLAQFKYIPCLDRVEDISKCFVSYLNE